jgi:hypothetical protein
MNRATRDQPDRNEDWIGSRISEAGDPRVEPRREHVETLRSLVLGRLHPSRPTRRWKARLLVGSGLAALMFAAAVVLLTLGRPVIAWAQVAEALQGRPWVHGKLVGPDDKVMFEEWLSSNRNVSGVKAGPLIAFHDHKRKVVTKYFPGKDVVYRLPEGTPQEANFLRQVLDLLLDPKGPAKFPFPGMELIGQSSREVEEDGKKSLEIELLFRFAGGSRGGPRPMIIRVDPSTKLPQSLVMQSEDGMKYRASIDYPDHGPADVFDMGVPRTAKVVDRSPNEDVDRVLAKLKAGREQFDDYCAFVVENRLLSPDNLTGFTAYRVWRKGRRWRVEQMRPEPPVWAPPADVNLAWWKTHQGDFVFVPRIVSDGKEYWDYYLADAWKPGMSVHAPGSGQVVGPNQLMAPADDPVLPFWCQDLLPEQTGHPTAGVGQPDHDREFLVESKPESGPPGTILLRGRDPNPLIKQTADHFRLWIDPASFLAMRTEIRVSEAGDLTKIAFIDTHVLESVAKSPKGHAYPTRSRQVAYNGKRESVMTFTVDFDAQIPDELFRPLK